MCTVNELGTLNTFNRCALVRTMNKVCTTRGWQHTLPRNLTLRVDWTKALACGFEPAATLRTSGLIGFEADGETTTST